MNRQLRTLEGEIRATATLSAEYLALPDDFRELRAIEIQTSPISVPTYMDPMRLRQNFTASTVGIPKFYTITDGQFQFAPPPESSTTIEIIYAAKIPALTDSNTTNWLLDKHPDVYLAASLAHAQGFLRDDQDAARWNAAWEEGLGEIIFESKMKKAGTQPLQMRPSVNEVLNARH